MSCFATCQNYLILDCASSLSGASGCEECPAARVHVQKQILDGRIGATCISSYSSRFAQPCQLPCTASSGSKTNPDCSRATLIVYNAKSHSLSSCFLVHHTGGFSHTMPISQVPSGYCSACHNRDPLSLEQSSCCMLCGQAAAVHSTTQMQCVSGVHQAHHCRWRGRRRGPAA